MTDYLTNDTDLAAVANAIRTKGGTSASLSFPNGFVSAINDIPSGGGVTQKKVTISLKSGLPAVVQDIDKMPRAVLIDVNGGKVTWQ